MTLIKLGRPITVLAGEYLLAPYASVGAKMTGRVNAYDERYIFQIYLLVSFEVVSAFVVQFNQLSGFLSAFACSSKRQCDVHVVVRVCPRLVGGYRRYAILAYYNITFVNMFIKLWEQMKINVIGM